MKTRRVRRPPTASGPARACRRGYPGRARRRARRAAGSSAAVPATGRWRAAAACRRIAAAGYLSRAAEADRLEHRASACSRASRRAGAEQVAESAGAARISRPSMTLCSTVGAGRPSSAGRRCRAPGPGSSGKRMAIEQQLAPRRPLDAEQHSQKGGLAAARGADDGAELVLAHARLTRSSTTWSPYSFQRLRATRWLMRLAPRSRRTRGSAARKRRSAADRRAEGQQGDPGDVGQDHVHRQVAPHQEDAVAEPLGRGDGLRRNQKQPGRAQRQPQRVDQPRQRLREHDAEGDLPGRGAERLRLDQLLVPAARAMRPRGRGR